MRRFLEARAKRAAGRARAQRSEQAGASCLYGVPCQCSCSLIVKEELNIFSLGLSPNLEAEGKMWWGVERGLESEMRGCDDLRRQAQTLFPGQTTPIAASQAMG